MEYLTRSDLAAMFHVGERTIHNYMKKGVLPAPMQLGRKLLWKKSDIERRMVGYQSELVEMDAPKKKRGRPRKSYLRAITIG
jgi:predicted DNA-binding transcriptional regulator AlpA